MARLLKTHRGRVQDAEYRSQTANTLVSIVISSLRLLGPRFRGRVFFGRIIPWLAVHLVYVLAQETRPHASLGACWIIRNSGMVLNAFQLNR